MGLLVIQQGLGDAVNESGNTVLPSAFFSITKSKLFVQNAYDDAAELLLKDKFMLN